MRKLFLVAALVWPPLLSQAKIVTQKIEYKDGASVLEGYLAYDDKHQAKRPGVVVVHDWMGLGEYSERRARELAGLGYVAFAADIYGKGVRPKNSQEASELAGKYKGDRNMLRKRANAALAILKAQTQVDGSHLAAMGYCFGGTTVLEMARSGADLKAVVSFHGGLDSKTPQDAKNIKAKLLILHGALDPYVPVADLEAFIKELNNTQVDYQFISYSGAVHAFTHPEAGNDITKGAAYNEAADKRSFQAMKTFFAETL